MPVSEVCRLTVDSLAEELAGALGGVLSVGRQK